MSGELKINTLILFYISIFKLANISLIVSGKFPSGRTHSTVQLVQTPHVQRPRRLGLRLVKAVPLMAT